MEPSDPVEVGNISESLFRIEMDKLEITNMRSLNPVLENLAGVKSKGNVYAMDFEINGNDSSATGKVNFQYENFHLDILKNNKKSFFLTTLGNTFLKNKNLEGSKNYRPGKYEFTRIREKAIFNYWWNCIKTGILYTVAPKADKNRKTRK